MPKWGYIIVLFVLTAFSGPGKQPPKTYISWDPARPLVWADFKGKPVASSREAAMTASSIEFTYETNGYGGLSWQVRSKFFPELSWSKSEHQSALILQHERLHFDITELYARIMRKRFREEIKSMKDVHKFKPIAKAVMDEWNEEQGRYDTETRHSTDHVKQAEWNQAVAERLEELSAYAGLAFTIQK